MMLEASTAVLVGCSTGGAACLSQPHWHPDRVRAWSRATRRSAAIR